MWLGSSPYKRGADEPELLGIYLSMHHGDMILGLNRQPVKHLIICKKAQILLGFANISFNEIKNFLLIEKHLKSRISRRQASSEDFDC